MREPRRLWPVVLYSALAFAGGAFGAHLSYAEPLGASVYAPLSRLAEVLVFVENRYVDPVKREQLLSGAIKGMVRELDPHSAFLDEKAYQAFNEDARGQFGGIGVEVDFKHDFVVVIAPLEGTPAARAGIKAGDKIIAVDGQSLRGLSIEQITERMRGPAHTSVKISIRRDKVNDLIHLDMVREHIKVRSVEAKRLVNGMAYLRIKQFQQGSHEELLDVLGELRAATDRPIRGLLLDMRGNPGGLVDEASAIADEFLTAGGIFSTRHRGIIDENVRATRGGALIDTPVVTLVNEYSASAAELIAGALQDNGRSIIVGSRTFGKGSVQTIFPLSRRTGLRLTTMRYYTPNGHPIQARGIAPDITIRYTDSRAPKALSEKKLQGHLPAENAGRTTRSRRTVDGGTRPKYTPIDQLDADPRSSDDRALKEAFIELERRVVR